jgi:hypothetical protein
MNLHWKQFAQCSQLKRLILSDFLERTFLGHAFPKVRLLRVGSCRYLREMLLYLHLDDFLPKHLGNATHVSLFFGLDASFIETCNTQVTRSQFGG